MMPTNNQQRIAFIIKNGHVVKTAISGINVVLTVNGDAGNKSQIPCRVTPLAD